MQSWSQTDPEQEEMNRKGMEEENEVDAKEVEGQCVGNMRETQQRARANDRIFSIHHPFTAIHQLTVLLRKRIMAVSKKNLLLQIASKSVKLSCTLLVTCSFRTRDVGKKMRCGLGIYDGRRKTKIKPAT